MQTGYVKIDLENRILISQTKTCHDAHMLSEHLFFYK